MLETILVTFWGVFVTKTGKKAVEMPDQAGHDALRRPGMTGNTRKIRIFAQTLLK